MLGLRPEVALWLLSWVPVKLRPKEFNGDTVNPVRPYGVGIDCHSRFIQVCVLVQRDALRRWERERLGTTWLN